jgi:ADP-ribose pyrophosphatase YjhB (NUDIX family)
MPEPRITVAAIAEDTGRFLLVEESIGGRRLFNQPAGHVEAEETLVAAVVREAREESAWRFEPQDLVNVYLWRNPAGDSLFLRFAFCGVVSEHDAAQPLDEGIVRGLGVVADLTREAVAASLAADGRTCAAGPVTVVAP